MFLALPDSSALGTVNCVPDISAVVTPNNRPPLSTSSATRNASLSSSAPSVPPVLPSPPSTESQTSLTTPIPSSLGSNNQSPAINQASLTRGHSSFNLSVSSPPTNAPLTGQSTGIFRFYQNFSLIDH